MLQFSNNIINAFAIQAFLNRNRVLDASSPSYYEVNNNIDRVWRAEIDNWNLLSDDERELYLAESRQYLSDWCARYSDSAQYLLDNWHEVIF
jgi:hypothetical protein